MKFIQNPFDSTALLLAGIINNITAVIGKLMLLVIEMLIVPILGYNGFADARIVDLGWSLVRDVVNMGVVIILIVIAVMTIFGSSKANWTQQLPRLFIGVILVNFSRVIIGALIDISQVIMFTFVNAIIDIAAGNFAQMLGLTQFGQFSNDFIDQINEKGSGIEAFEYLGSAYLQLALFLAIFGVLLLLALMYIWRIVMLWLIIILAPAAFFLNGMKGLFHAADSYYSEWWKNLTSALLLGPLLTFFLWLALAASSGTNLAVTQDFPLPDDPADTGLALENFSIDSLLGTFVALALLIAGMKFSQSAAATMGGPVSKFISEDFGKKLVTGAVKYPAALVNRGGGRLLDRVGGTNYGSLTGLGKGVAGAVGKEVALPAARLAANLPVVGGIASGAVAAAGGGLMRFDKKNQDEVRKGAQDRVKEMPAGQLDALVAEAAVDGAMFTKLPVEQQQAIRAKLGTDQKAQKRAKENFEQRFGKDEGGKRYNELMGKVLKSVDAGKDDWLDDTGKSAFIGTKLGHLDLVEPKTDPKTGAKQTKEEAVSEYLEDLKKDGKFNANLIGAGSLKDAGVKAALEKFSVREDKDGRKIAVWTDLAEGKHGAKQREAIEEAWKGKPAKPAPGKTYVATDFELPVGAPATRVDQVATSTKQAIQGGAIATMDPAALAAMIDAMKSIPPEKIAVTTRVDADQQMLLRPGATAGDVFGPLPGTGLNGQIALRVQHVLERDSKNASHILVDVQNAVTTSGGASNELTDVILESVNPDSLKKLKDQFMKAEGDELLKLQQAVEAIALAVQAERRTITDMRSTGRSGEIDKSEESRLKKFEQTLRRLDNFRRPTPPATP